MLSEIPGLALDVAAHGLLAGVLGAGFGRGCGVAVLDGLERGPLGGFNEVA